MWRNKRKHEEKLMLPLFLSLFILFFFSVSVFHLHHSYVQIFLNVYSEYFN